MRKSQPLAENEPPCRTTSNEVLCGNRYKRCRFCGVKKGSIPWRIVDEALSGDIIPLLCDEILAEYEDVLSRPKFEISDAVISSFLDDLKQRAVFANPAVVEGAFPDQSDVVFYAVLMEKRKEAEARLVTGNLRHFPSRSFVVTPKEMLRVIRQARGEQDDD